jgi:hypothetical protein
VLRAHIRRELDKGIVAKLVAMAPPEIASGINQEYQHGIGWPLVRDVLRGKQGSLSGGERHGLRILNIGAFWSAERKHQAGLVDSSKCATCGEPLGDTCHLLYGCVGQTVAMSEACWQYRCVARDWRAAERQRHHPLHVRCLPPVARQW